MQAEHPDNKKEDLGHSINGMLWMTATFVVNFTQHLKSKVS